MRTLFSLRSALLFCLLISGVSHAGDLKARKPQSKRPLDAVVATPGAVTGEIVVKFRDEAQARLTASGRLTFQGVAVDGKRAQKIMNRHALRTSIQASLEDMYGVMQAAEANSGIASPDLPGMISIVLDPTDIGGIQSLARQLHVLECVEYASIQETLVPSSVLGVTGSCAILNVDPPICVAGLTPEECDDLNGVFEPNSDDCPTLAISQLNAPTGACCLPGPNGPVCETLTEPQCIAGGGSNFWGPYIDSNGDGIFDDPNPAAEGWSCDDPNRVTACTTEEAEVGACCLAPGGTFTFDTCIDLTFIECKNQGGLFAKGNAQNEEPVDNPDGLCVYAGTEEYECISEEILCGIPGLVLGECQGRTGHITPGCDNTPCCNAVGAIDPYCVLYESSDNLGSYDAYCQMIAGVLEVCEANAFTAADSAFSSIVYEKHWTGDLGASSPEIVQMVVSVDPTCDGSNDPRDWDFRCAEIARLFAYRTAVLGGIASGNSFPDLREFQYNLSDLPWPYESRDEFVRAKEGGLTTALEDEYFEDIPWITGWEGDDPVRSWPQGFDGKGLGLRGQGGEPFDYNPAGPLDASNSNTGHFGAPGAGDGWYTPGENWRDWGVDGEPVRFIGSEDLLPVIGAGLDGTDVQLVGDPVNCDVVRFPLDFGLNPETDLTAKDRGECDGLWTEPSGGDGFAWRIARDGANGTGAPLLDQSGLMSEDVLVDRGDEVFRGRGAKVAVLDFSFWRGHEDLERIEMETNDRGQYVPVLDSDDQPKPTIFWRRETGNRYVPRKPYVIVEEGINLITIPEIGYPDHGTAVLSTISALDELRDWGEPDQGIAGIVPEAQPYFYPLIAREAGSDGTITIREVTAWFRAIQELGPGDVICGAYNPAGQTYCASQNEAIVTLTRDVAFNEGIVCVVAAGNERRDVQVEAGGGGGDDGAELDGMMIVGAVSPSDYDGCLRHPESNWGEQVDFAAWGDYVVAAGYGDFYSGLNSDVLVYPEGFPDCDGDGIPGDCEPLVSDLSASRTRAYTSQFGGTSAAAAQIAGAACALQGLAKQTFGIPAGPGPLRDTAMVPYTYKDPNDPTGETVDEYNTEWKFLPSPQGWGVGRAQLEDDYTGQAGEIEDGQLQAVAEGIPGDPIRTGQFPIIWRWARDDTAVVQVTSLPGGVFENEVPGLLGVYPIKGTPSGNVYSLKGDDSIFYGVASEFAYSFEGAAVPGDLNNSPALTSSDLFKRAFRPVTGSVTDIALLMQVDSDPNFVTGINADLRLREPGTLATVIGLELWDNRDRRWRTTDVEFITFEDEPEADGDLLIELESFEGIYVRRFINSDGLCWARIWTLSYGDTSNGDFNTGSTDYQLFWDLTNISFDIPGSDNP